MAGMYRRDLALVHHLAFGSHADACAPGILALLEPVRAAGGRVLELGCGSGALTRHLVAAGHRVRATDASPAMVELAGDAEVLVLPDDPLPEADAVVSVGHVLNYLPDEASIDRALAAIAAALRPGGVLAVDLLDRRYGDVRRDAPPSARVEDGWALFARYEAPAPDRFVRHITTFVAGDDGSWRRDDERHENVLVDTGRKAAALAGHGVDARVSAAFGAESLPEGLVAVTGRKGA
jgi:SAM-dependent methyltransferase